MICQVCAKEIDKKIGRKHGTFCSDICWMKANIDEQNTCWIWKRAKESNGYAYLQKNGVFVSGHRYMYELYYGALAEDVMVLHSCHNRSCVNPEHLRTGSHIDNMQDMREANRSASGEKSGASYFREIDIHTIFYLREKGYKQKSIAEIFNVPQSTISAILTGRNWKYFNQRKDDGVQREHSAAQ